MYNRLWRETPWCDSRCSNMCCDVKTRRDAVVRRSEMVRRDIVIHDEEVDFDNEHLQQFINLTLVVW